MNATEPRAVRVLARRARGSAAAALAWWALALGLLTAGVLLAVSALAANGWHAAIVLVGLGLALYWTVSQEAREATRRWSRDRANRDDCRAAVERQAARERARGRERLVALQPAPGRPPARSARTCSMCLDGTCGLCRTVVLETAGMDRELSRLLGRPA